ncbi:MAG: hypothetical protein AB7F83_05250 [Lysobacterales bacterium]
MRRPPWPVAVVLLSLIAPSAGAGPTGYAATFDPASADSYRLLSIDLATGTTTAVGRIGFVDVEGLAVAPEGTIYGVADGNKTLITINPFNGRGTAVGGQNGNLGLSGQGVGQFDSLDFGLTFSCDGRLWLSSDTTDMLWSVNRNTGQATLVGSLGKHMSGLAANSDGIYGIGTTGDDGLYRIDVGTETATTAVSPSVTRVGAGLGGQASSVDAGLDFDNAGVLWAILDHSPPENNRPSDIVQIDLSTGAARFIATTLPEVEGLAIAPVRPCGMPMPGGDIPQIPAAAPPAWLALGLGVFLLGLLAVRLRLTSALG